MKVITGVSAKEARDDLSKVMLASGMDEKSATAFNSMWGSAISKAKDSGNWQLSDAETEKSRLEIAHFARQNKMDPAMTWQDDPAHGRSATIQNGRRRSQGGGHVQQMGIEAAGTFTQMATADLKIMGQLVRPEGGGAFRSLGEQSAGISAMSGTTSMTAAPAELRSMWAEVSAPKSAKEQDSFAAIGIVPGKTDMAGSCREMERLHRLSKRPRASSRKKQSRRVHVTSRQASRGIVNAYTAREAWKSAMAKAKEETDPAKIRAAMEATDVESPACDGRRHSSGRAESSGRG